MRLNNLIENIDYIELVNCENTAIDIDGISYNSKQAGQNDVFVCLVGEHVDGHEYAEEAVLNGYNEGFNKGIEQGNLEKSKEIARNMLQENIDINIISKVTGFHMIIG